MVKAQVLGLLAVLSATSRADRVDDLHDRARALPDVRVSDADLLVDAALQEETSQVPAELIVAVAHFETNFRPVVRYGHVCGVMQVYPRDIGEPMSSCREWERDLRLAVRAGVREMELELADRRVHGDLRLMLGYRACGNSFFSGTCHKGRYPGLILRRMRRLRPAS